MEMGVAAPCLPLVKCSGRRGRDRNNERRKESEKGERMGQRGSSDCALETGGRWKAEGLPFSWR